MTDINKYMNKKLIQTIIYSGEISSILDDEELRLGMSTSEFVDDLYEFVSANLENPHIEGTHLRDLATLVSEVRFLTDERKKANEIVSMVNKTSEEGQKKFLRREFIKRFSLNPSDIPTIAMEKEKYDIRVENAKLPPGYVPIGMKEYGGIIYIACYNPLTNNG